MGSPLRIIHLEDLETDAEIVHRALKKSSLEFDLFQVSNREDFVKALDSFDPDVIISDHSLPGFDSHEALKILREKGMEIPFILVTATVSEEYAVTVIKEGASDYILKDRLQRLPNAIEAAMEKFNAQLAYKESVEELRSSEKKYKLLFEANPMPMIMISRQSQKIIAVNQAAISHYGYSREEFLSLNAQDLGSGITDQDEHKPDGGRQGEERVKRQVKKDGSVIMVETMEHEVVYEDQEAILLLAIDVTEKLRAREALVEQKMLQQKLISETSIQVQEKERDEIGKELHDHINQILATANLYLQMGISKSGDEHELFSKSREYIMMAVEEIRKLSHNLVAPSLGQVSMEEAVRELMENIKLTTSLAISLEMDNFSEEWMEHNMKLMFYRVIQEQITNILKHAEATRAKIRFESGPSHVHLYVSDNGKGFKTSGTGGGIGLKNIRNRAEFYGGRAKIESEPGKGCTLQLVIPVRRAG